MLFRVVTCVIQRKYSESPRTIEPHDAIDIADLSSMHDTCCA